MKTVMILGTEYKIFEDVSVGEMPENSDGCMDQSTRTIKVVKFESGRNSLQDLENYKKEVLRHEIIHAFLYESGLWNNSESVNAWACSEEITDWMAIQFPKIHRAFTEVGCE